MNRRNRSMGRSRAGRRAVPGTGMPRGRFLKTAGLGAAAVAAAAGTASAAGDPSTGDTHGDMASSEFVEENGIYVVYYNHYGNILVQEGYDLYVAPGANVYGNVEPQKQIAGTYVIIAGQVYGNVRAEMGAIGTTATPGTTVIYGNMEDFVSVGSIGYCEVTGNVFIKRGSDGLHVIQMRPYRFSPPIGKLTVHGNIQGGGQVSVYGPCPVLLDIRGNNENPTQCDLVWDETSAVTTDFGKNIKFKLTVKDFGSLS